ncbi:ExbD/TolR family protein [Campylobacter majalis]|uniref:ExbD/TolR family protein n=1 Tax=Campylobacter majalis TaxID=2790656 RepID=UPI003D685916
MILNDGENELSEINVTPFIDVMLVLLIIFMVVTPIVTSSVKVELPKAVSEQKADVNKPLIISINEKNEIYFGTELVNADNIGAAMQEKIGDNKDNVVFFHVDKVVPYEILIATVEHVKKAGYSKIAFSSKAN